MTTCDKRHPLTTVCQDRNCWHGERNPIVRLLRRLDRVENDNRNLRLAADLRLRRAGGGVQ